MSTQKRALFRQILANSCSFLQTFVLTHLQQRKLYWASIEYTVLRAEEAGEGWEDCETQGR